MRCGRREALEPWLPHPRHGKVDTDTHLCSSVASYVSSIKRLAPCYGNTVVSLDLLLKEWGARLLSNLLALAIRAT